MSIVTLDKTITFALSVKDRHASVKWYGDMLGFTLRYHADEVGWSEMATMTENVVLGFGEYTEPKPGNAIPVFGITDLDSGRTAMEKVGVKFDGDTQTIDGMVKLATFYDPDGNALMLAQDLSASG